MTINEKMYLVTADNDGVIIGVANTLMTARAFALTWLEQQYDPNEWEDILEQEGFKSKGDFWAHMLSKDNNPLWVRFDMEIKEVKVLDKLIG